ncbi:MAG TPA: oxygenase MpaB family protein [Chthoniobacteraceae bacterium]|jgi:hypothetical protein|nr:oxygenase MpaB family protein [Chthoniobacteraceae bacterium]
MLPTDSDLANVAIPSAYGGAESARGKHGTRLASYARFLRRGDPLADAAVESLAPLGRAGAEQMIDRAVTEGIDAVTDAPEALRALFAQLDHVPFWFDPDLATLGGATFLRCRLGFLALACMSLPLIYSWPVGNKPLALSGELLHHAGPRLKQTTQFVYAVSQPDAVRRAGAGFRLIVRVRLMHAQVRRLLRGSGQWQEEAWGAPIDQCHTAGTNLLFSLGALQGLERIGYLFNPVERAAVQHLWRYIGWLMGIDPELLPADEPEAMRLLDLLFALEPTPDEDSRALAAALAGAANTYLHRFCTLPPTVVHGITRALIGQERADALGLPRTVWRWMVPLVRPATRLIERARLVSPQVRALARVAGPKAFRSLLGTRGLEGECGEFHLPEHLRRGAG